jgi:AcrR family transcriptional regulator
VEVEMNIVEKARKRYQAYDQQYAAIVEAAIRVFAEKNYDVGTMTMVAKEAGISEAMLYKHFNSKKDLFRTCFEQVTRDLMSRYRECYKKNRDNPLGYLEDSAAAYLNYVKQCENGAKFLVHLLSNSFDPDLRKSLTDFFKASLDTVKKALDLAAEKGDLAKETDTALLAWDYVGQYYTFLIAREMDMESMLGEDRVRAFVKAMFGRT